MSVEQVTTIDARVFRSLVGPLPGGFDWDRADEFRRIVDQWNAFSGGEIIPGPALRLTVTEAQRQIIPQRYQWETAAPVPTIVPLEYEGAPSEVDYWEEHPEHTRGDWRYEVINSNTNQGYWDWAYQTQESRREAETKS